MDPFGLLVCTPVGQVVFCLLVGLDIDVVFEEAKVVQDFQTNVDTLEGVKFSEPVKLRAAIGDTALPGQEGTTKFQETF